MTGGSGTWWHAALDLGWIFWGVPATCFALVVLYATWMLRSERRGEERTTSPSDPGEER